MTIKGISKFFESKRIPYWGRKDGEENKDPLYLTAFKGKRVAIECATLIYKQLWHSTKSATDRFQFKFSEQDGWNYPTEKDIIQYFEKHSLAYFSRIKGTGIIPVLVLEGKADNMKNATSAKRREQRDLNMKKAIDAQKQPNLDVFKASIHYIYSMNYDIYNKCLTDISKELNIECLMAKYEAEGVCARLVTDRTLSNACDFAMCEDYDIFMYGCHRVIRDVRNTKEQSHAGNFECCAYSLKNILKELQYLKSDDLAEYKEGLLKFQLLCVLSGTDYAQNVKNIGPAKLHKILSSNLIKSYSDMVAYDERFSTIPFAEIMNVISKNTEF